MDHDLVEKFRETLDTFTISDYHGLNSPGLTCYLNSVLQVLFMTEDFREAVKRCCSKDSTTIDPHLRKLFADLQKSVARTHNVTEKLGITNVYEQRDAAEYFEKILRLTSLEAAKMFKGELNHTTTCLECKERNDSRSFFWVLPLVVEDSCCWAYSVEKGLKTFFNGEKIDGDNKMYCSRCEKKQDADFGCEMTQNPEILTLLLKRFSFDSMHRCYIKLHCRVDVPQTLHVEDCKYDLYALVNHFGDLTGGHYTAHIKSFETQAWYHFDDDTVEVVKQPLFGAGENSLRSCTAYLLMYRKVSRNPEKTAHCAHSDVEAEGKHDEAERGHHINTGENLQHFTGDILNKGHDDTGWKKRTNTSGELENQLNQTAASVRPRTDMLLQTDSGADGDSYTASLQTQKPNIAKPQKDKGQKSHEANRLDTNSKEPMCHINTAGSPTVRLRPHHESHKTRREVNETVWETENNMIAKAGTKITSVTDSSLTGSRFKPAEAGVVKNQTESEEAEARIEGKSRRRGDAAKSRNKINREPWR